MISISVEASIHLDSQVIRQ